MMTVVERFDRLIADVKDAISQFDLEDGEDRTNPETAYVHGMKDVLDIVEAHANRLR